MMKGTSLAVFSALVVFLITLPAVGQDYTPDLEGRWCLGVGSSRSEPEDILDERWGIRVVGEYYFRNWISIMAEYYNYPWEGEFQDEGFSGELDTDVAALSIIFNFPQFSSFGAVNYNAYAGAGVDYYFFDLSLPTGIQGEIDDDLGLHVCAGINFFLTDNIALNLDFRFNLAEPDFSYSYGPVAVGTDIQLRSWVAGAAFKYYF